MRAFVDRDEKDNHSIGTPEELETILTQFIIEEQERIAHPAQSKADHGYSYINFLRGIKILIKSGENSLKDSPSLGRQDLINLILEKIRYLKEYAPIYADPSQRYPHALSLGILTATKIRNLENLLQIVELLETTCDFSLPPEIKTDLQILLAKAKDENRSLMIANEFELTTNLANCARTGQFASEDPARDISSLGKNYSLQALVAEIEATPLIGKDLNQKPPSQEALIIRRKITALCRAVQRKIVHELGTRALHGSLLAPDVFVTLPEIETHLLPRDPLQNNRSPHAGEVWELDSRGININDPGSEATAIRDKIVLALPTAIENSQRIPLKPRKKSGKSPKTVNIKIAI